MAGHCNWQNHTNKKKKKSTHTKAQHVFLPSFASSPYSSISCCGSKTTTRRRRRRRRRGEQKTTMDPEAFVDMLRQQDTAIRPALSTFSMLGKRPASSSQFAGLVEEYLQQDPGLRAITLQRGQIRGGVQKDRGREREGGRERGRERERERSREVEREVERERQTHPRRHPHTHTHADTHTFFHLLAFGSSSGCDIIFKLWDHDRAKNQSEDSPIILVRFRSAFAQELSDPGCLIDGHTDTRTRRHTQTQAHTQTHRHTDTQTHTQTDTSTHRYTQTGRYTHPYNFSR